MSEQVVRTVFRGATRTGTSVNGNPNWKIHTDAGDYRIQSDASVGYSIGNYLNRHIADSLIGVSVRLILNRAGRVSDVTLEDGTYPEKIRFYAKTAGGRFLGPFDYDHQAEDAARRVGGAVVRRSSAGNVIAADTATSD